MNKVSSAAANSSRINRGHRPPLSRHRDEVSATHRGHIVVLQIFDFFATPAFLAFLRPSKSRKSQATKYTAFKTNSSLNKHRISKNQWTGSANSLSFGTDQSGHYGV